MADYTSKPAQFRLPQWAHEFLAEESSVAGVSKTEVLVTALGAYKRKRFDELLAEGYRECAEENLAEAKLWEGTLMDGLDPEDW